MPYMYCGIIAWLILGFLILAIGIKTAVHL